ncbi:MAG: PSD1 and planctomycete cytochrome C domain-containing protein [Planctomycetota bacterium]
MNRIVARSILGLALLAVCSQATANEADDFFEKKIRPVLVEHCFDCHAGEADVIQGGLRLDDRDAMRRGGDSGAGVIPGKPGESLLLTAMRYDDLEMPPDGRLSAEILADFETWIRLGAHDPRDSKGEVVTEPESIDWEGVRNQWAYQPPQRHRPPTVQNRSWSSNAIDPFVLARLEAEELEPGPEADPIVFIRRLSFDLRGLPPTPEEVDEFIHDASPRAKANLIDRFLSSPQHAERWTRMWLDVARYAEDQAHKVGSNDSLIYPNAYRYRNWVIDAFAQDLSYDEFVRMQLAADHYNPDHPEMHLALGFLGLGPKYYRRNSPEVMADEWEDRVDTVSRGLLGLTVACARCHDHKYDPIPTEDYYALAGVFASTEMFNRPLPEKESGGNGQAKKPVDAVHIVRDGTPKDLNVMIRGDVNRKGDVVPRRFLTVLSSTPKPLGNLSGRGDLAEAIVSDENPLTARVIVNRVWREFFGRGLVDTPSNFGALGSEPSHPQLLDDLARRFMDNDWSLKWLHREIALSSAYGQSSDVRPNPVAVDPENRFLWRVPRRRLSVEAYRDAILSVAGRLDQQVGGPSLQPDEPSSSRRTVYSEISRMDLNPMLARFDFPDPNNHSAGRFETTTPLQKLFLLNSPFLVHQADSLASRLKTYGGSYRSRIEFAYRLLYGRMPTEREMQLGESFVASGEATAWSQYAQTLLISNEMFLVD